MKNIYPFAWATMAACLLVALFLTNSAWAQEGEKSGTVRLIYKNGVLVVEENGVEKEIDEVSFGTNSGPKKLRRIDNNGLLFDWGFNNYLYNGSLAKPAEIENLTLNTWPSMNFHLGLFQQRLNFAKHKWGFIYGIGLEFNDFRFAYNIDLKKNDSTGMVSFDRREIEGWRRNKLSLTFLEVPLQLQYKSNPEYPDRSFKVQFGVNLGYRINSYFKTVWFDDGKQKPKTRSDFYTNEVRATGVLKVGYGRFQLYGTYSFTPLFQENRGPELLPVAAGLVIYGW